MPEMITPVTPHVATALSNAKAMLDKDSALLKDRQDFPQMTGVLRALVSALLAAPSTVPLDGRPVLGARFDLDPDNPLSPLLATSLAYVQGSAQTVRKDGGLSQYDGSRARIARDRLASLYRAVLDAIYEQASADLKELGRTDPAHLIQAAEVLGTPGQQRMSQSTGSEDSSST